jgi:predicted transcriptional regulator
MLEKNLVKNLSPAIQLASSDKSALVSPYAELTSSQKGRRMPGRNKKALGRGSRVIRVISHPNRNAIQCILYNRMASPKEMAEELQEDVSNINHHVENLKKNGRVESVKEEPRRGAVEHFYRAVVPSRLLHDDESWSKLPRSIREGISEVTFQGIVAEGTCALDEGTFDARKDRHLSRVSMQVDERGCRELLECQAALLERIERIKAESAVRLQADGKRGFTFLAAMIGIEMPRGRGLTDPRT